MLEHLIELRRRAIQIVAVFASLFFICFFMADDLFQFCVSPLLAVIPDGGSLIATEVTSPFMTPIQVAMDVALILTTPFALFQLWQFTAPGLYQHEKQHIKGIVIASIVLFIAGMAFCFLIVLPFILQFFAKTLPTDVRYMPDINYAVSFISRMLLIFGISFQLPLFCVVLNRLNLVTLSGLRTFRPYFIVSAFVVGMLLTPPDVFSQILLAVPLCLLYELGIFFIKWRAHQEDDSSLR